MPSAEAEALDSINDTLKRLFEEVLEPGDGSQGRALLEKDEDGRYASTTDAVIRLDRTLKQTNDHLDRIGDMLARIAAASEGIGEDGRPR